MRGLARRKLGIAARRRLRALPQDDGLIPVRMSKRDRWGDRKLWIELIEPERMHQHCACTMARHDARDDKERWGGNQWGEEWVTSPSSRSLYARDFPLLATDLSLNAWRRVLKEIRAA
jgi:hypothetical protein